MLLKYVEPLVSSDVHTHGQIVEHCIITSLGIWGGGGEAL